MMPHSAQSGLVRAFAGIFRRHGRTCSGLRAGAVAHRLRASPPLPDDADARRGARSCSFRHNPRDRSDGRDAGKHGDSDVTVPARVQGRVRCRMVSSRVCSPGRTSENDSEQPARRRYAVALRVQRTEAYVGRRTDVACHRLHHRLVLIRSRRFGRKRTGVGTQQRHVRRTGALATFRDLSHVYVNRPHRRPL
jgi:hypothetical protein